MYLRKPAGEGETKKTTEDIFEAPSWALTATLPIRLARLCGHQIHIPLEERIANLEYEGPWSPETRPAFK